MFWQEAAVSLHIFFFPTSLICGKYFLMPHFTDQTGRTIHVNEAPRRIVSLVPSQTELLADLGLHAEVIGITKFCIHPAEWFQKKTRVGGTKQLHLDSIFQLQPDLVIANKEENTQQQIEQLADNFPVWISDIRNLQDALDMIQQVGEMTSRKAQARQIVENIKTSFSSLLQPLPQRKACYLIWQNPFMTVGSDTFIHAMMNAAGFENVFGDCTRYPKITLDDIQEKRPDVLLLSSEPFPFHQSHAEVLQMHLPNTKIVLVDGEMFSWYGSRLLKAPGYFKKLQSQFA